jgi:hypothetical protein
VTVARRGGPALAVLLALIVASGAGAADLPRYGVSPLLPPEHWAVRAATRLDGVGLVTGFLPASQAAPLYMVWAALDEGARRAAAERPEMAELARGWRERFLAEWSGADEKGLLRLVGLGATAGYGWSGASPSPPPEAPALGRLSPPVVNTPVVALQGVAALSDHLALGLVPSASLSYLSLSGELVVGVGPVALSVGRAPGQTGLGPPGAGVVLGGLAETDRIAFQIYRPVDVYIGLLALDVSVARMIYGHPPGATLLTWALRYQPVPRLTLAVQGGVMADGDYFRAFTYRGNGAENNVLSVAGRWRLPTENCLPITLHLDWGTDDNGGAWYQAPGIDAGILLPSLPFAPELSLALEASFFGTTCKEPSGGTWCRSPGYPLDWYTHGTLAWVQGNHPLGQRMGGSGREILLRAEADLLDAALWLRGDAFLWERFSGNLYAPYTGVGGGFDLEAAFRVLPRLEVGLGGRLETGAGWTSGGVGARVSGYY